MRVLTRPNLGGPTRQAIALWHAHRELGATTLLVTGIVDAGETMLSPAAGAVPQLTWEEALGAGEQASGWVQVDAMQRGVRPWRDRQAVRGLRQLLRTFRPEVVHTHTSKAGWLGRQAAWAEGGALIAHTFHGHVLQDYFSPPLAMWLRWLERRWARRSDLLFAVSASCAEELAAAGVAARDRLVVVPPAVPLVPRLSRTQARHHLSLGVEPRVVCVGRLVPIKRVAHFVEMVGQLGGVYGDVVGDGPERKALTSLAAQVAPLHMTFRGPQAHVASWLSAYDALVLPSVREGLPLVAVEAFRAGVPVVGYDVPGVRDALAAGRGVLVPVASGPAGLAAAVRAVLAGSAAPTRAAVDEFAPAAVASTLLRYYLTAQDQRSSLP